MDYSIGRLAKLTGLPVKTIRFYSDAGVLPEPARTAAGYRVYGDEHRVHLELVRTLREIGVDLATIRSLGRRPLKEVLDLHLQAVETQIAALGRTRAVLRATLEKDGPAEEDLGRLHALGRLGAAEMEKLLNSFVDEVGGDIPARLEWLRSLRACLVPSLPAEPTIAQLDAWLELTELLADEDYRERLRSQSEDFWQDADHDAWRKGQPEVMRLALDASRSGIAPGTPEASRVLDRVLALTGQSRAELLRAFEEHDPRASRHWELVAIINDTPLPREPAEAYGWLEATVRHPSSRIVCE
ncbi:MerR family transcriptional regulator [Nonomuraea sp. NPDC046570]|uniref:helix-turn-helix domain-containing protein n=1 Tax=Nonomuraea sp. NPDC046570 TaxID=3155255 RepID=UPI0033C79F5B